MSDATPTEEGNRSPSLGGRVEAVCDRFEAAWKAGGRPRIEDYLGDLPEPGRSALLHALLELELAYRDRAGEPTDAGRIRAAVPGACRADRGRLQRAGHLSRRPQRSGDHPAGRRR